ncbi:MAG: hypothetical protein KatS3mg115_0846 [Candidatus Poribacteria bacterium]|nr:MAG: hypothetical protein KatS3mg115_0846 [Candidatus Poribacteria bacterium]
MGSSKALGLLVTVLAFLGGCGAASRVDAYNVYAIRAAQLELWKEAALRWQQALELAPEDPRFWNNLAVAYEAQGQLEKALEAYRRAVALDPDRREFRRNLIRCERQLERKAEVQELPLPDANAEESE